MVLPAQAGLFHGGRSVCTAPGSASGSYPERVKGHYKNAQGHKQSVWSFYQHVNRILNFPHPLFHDVVGMIGHFFHYDKGRWVDRNVKRCASNT